MLIAGGAVNIGFNDKDGKRPVNYTRGELPRGKIISDRSHWVGNTMHGWRGRVYLIQCEDGLWFSYPQPTSEEDWASFLLDGSHPSWIEEELKKFTS
jgi:hypothetical protein